MEETMANLIHRHSHESLPPLARGPVLTKVGMGVYNGFHLCDNSKVREEPLILEHTRKWVSVF